MGAATTEVTLEGLHALKHALRFGAVVREIVVADGTDLDHLAGFAAGTLPPLPVAPTTVTPARFAALVSTRRLAVPVVAYAQRPAVDVAAVLADPRPAPVVVLEAPRDAGNLGAVVRVAAAAGAAGVLTLGGVDPWTPAAIRGAAGLQFALPVAAVTELPASDRPLTGFDPAGQPLGELDVPPRTLLAFGSERHGLSVGLRGRADLLAAIPMAAAVSSLNVATAAAIALYNVTGLQRRPA